MTINTNSKKKKEEKYSLKDLHETYKQYTTSTNDPDLAEISRQLANKFKKFGIEPYRALIMPKKLKRDDKGNGMFKSVSFKDGKYTFTERQAKLLGLFHGCTAPKLSKNINSYNDKSVLNPFLHEKHRKSMGISNMKEYTEHFVEFEKGEFLSSAEACEVKRISNLVDFVCKFKQSLEKLIFAIFYMDNLSPAVFDKILARIDGFTDEMHLIGNIKDASIKDLYDLLGEIHHYHSVDTLMAASLADALFSVKASEKIPMEIFDNREIMERHLQDIQAQVSYKQMVRTDTADENFLHSDKNYRKYLKTVIYNMLKRHAKLFKAGFNVEEIEECLMKEFDYDAQKRSVETRIIWKYIMPFGKQISEGKKSLEETTDEVYAEVEKILLDSDSKSQELMQENPEIGEILDNLLFKPFIRYHDMDIERIRKKSENNIEYINKFKP